MSDSAFTVFVVDDDSAVLRGLARLLAAAGYRTQTFASPQEFLSAHDSIKPGCAIFDVAMPAIDGLALQRTLCDGGNERPIIFMSGKGDIPTSVRAMRAGAIDFLTKPVRADALLEAIGRARQRDAQARRSREEIASIERSLAKLTPREREVFAHVVAGRLNKQIACDLGIGEKTIKVHRGRMMGKLGVHTIQDLVRLSERVGIRGP